MKGKPKDPEFLLICESNRQRDLIILALRSRIRRAVSENLELSQEIETENEKLNPTEQLNDADWELLLTNATEFTYRKDEVIFEQVWITRVCVSITNDFSHKGCTNVNLYRILCGNVRVVKDESKILSIMGPKSVFGEMSFLGRNETTASVIAEEDNVKVLQIEINFLLDLFETESMLAMKFYRNIAMKLSQRLRKLPSTLAAEVAPQINRNEKRLSGDAERISLESFNRYSRW